MAVKMLWTTPPQFVDANGDPYSGAYLFFYAAGSSTKQDTFTDDTGGTACPNPITLNASGYPAVSGTILAPWGTVGQTYKIGLAAPGASDPPAAFIWSQDDVAPINDTTVTIDQWVSGPAPTYVSATQFTLVGDQTSTFHVGRRLKTTNTAGTVYSRITVSAFGAVTTVTVVNDSGTLDSGLSAVSYGLLSTVGSAVPAMYANVFRVLDPTDPTKAWAVAASGITTGTTRTWTVPDASDTFAGIATTQTLTNKTLTSAVLNTGVSGTAMADQTAQETGTSTSQIVSPGVQQFHPSAAKAWGVITPNTTVTASYPASGVSVTKNGTGDYTVTHGCTFSSTGYATIVQANKSSAILFAGMSAQTTTTFSVRFSDANTNATDPDVFYYACFGDL